MVNYLIIEDESLAFAELKRMIDELRPDFQMSGWAQSVSQSVSLLNAQSFSLIFADISLADGLCFEIFNRIDISAPVIFTTAYDEYAIKAFKANGIDYLLKPIEKAELEGAILRFERNAIRPAASDKAMAIEASFVHGCKTRFMVKSGDSYFHVKVNDIEFVYSEDKYTFIHLFSGQRHIIDASLDTLEDRLDKKRFYRTSRGCIVNIQAVERFSKYFGGRLKLHCDPQLPADRFVSRGRARGFMEWMDGII